MHEGRFSLTRIFRSFAVGAGAEWVMWILVFLSVISIAIMLERAWFYRRLRDDLDVLSDRLRKFLHDNDIKGARKLLEASPSPAAMIGLAGLHEVARGPASASEAMSGAAARAKMQLDRFLAVLATIGNNAPFIGLLGTVIGIVQSFAALQQSQTSAAAARNAAQAAAAIQQAQASLDATSRVMGTIAEALVATAIGLFVAIPAVAAYNYFQRKIKGIVSSGDAISHVVLAHLHANAVAGSVASVAAQETSKPSKASSERSERSSASSSKSGAAKEEKSAESSAPAESAE